MKLTSMFARRPVAMEPVLHEAPAQATEWPTVRRVLRGIPDRLPSWIRRNPILASLQLTLLYDEALQKAPDETVFTLATTLAELGAEMERAIMNDSVQREDANA